MALGCWPACTCAAWCSTTASAGKAPSSMPAACTRCCRRCWRRRWRCRGSAARRGRRCRRCACGRQRRRRRRRRGSTCSPCSLLLLVVLPRAAARAVGRLARALAAAQSALPLGEPYFQRLLRQQRGGSTLLRVWPHARTPDAAALAACARCWPRASATAAAADRADGGLRQRGGAGRTPRGRRRRGASRCSTSAPRPSPRARAASAGPGRARPAGALVLLVDEAAFVQRFGASSPRRAERRAGLAALAAASAPAGVRRAGRGRPGGVEDALTRGAAAHARHDDGTPRARQPAAEPGVAHQRRQDHAGAHAARPRCRRGARRAARDRVRRRLHDAANAAGRALRLWDTPGFGDSVRLLRRMRQSGNPMGWFLSEVWDRWRDRPFWSSQQALRNVARRGRRGAVPGQRGRGARGRRLRGQRDGAAGAGSASR